jgi:DNA-binding CsgD family transcriptional regulator
MFLTVNQVSPVTSQPVLNNSSAQSALLNLHATLEFSDLWNSLQQLIEVVVPHDTLVMSVNYLDWKRETSTRRFSSVHSSHKHNDEANRMVAQEGPGFFQPFLDSHPNIPVYQHSQLVSDPRQIDRTPYYRRYMRHYDWRYSAHLLFWHGRGVETSFALRRRAEQGDFTPEEMRALQAIHPHIKVAFDRMRTFEQERQRRRLLESFYRAKPEAVLFLDWNLGLNYASQDALALCAVWNLGATRARSYNPQAVFEIPAAIREACEQLRQEWQSGRQRLCATDTGLPLRQVSSTQPGHEALVTLRSERGSTLTKPVFVIRLRVSDIATTDISVRPEPSQDRLLHQLTPGERELAACVCEGLTNKEIATRLNKTEGSVKVQLSGIYQKLRVNSRSRLIVALH